MIYSDNPVADWNRKLEDEEDYVNKLPICEICGQHITDEEAFCIDDSWYCISCFEYEFKKEIEIDE